MKKRHYAYILSGVILLALPCCLASLLYGKNLPDKCLLVPVNGSCKAMIEKYFFNQKTGRCAEYIYDGCGSIVPFDTLVECQALCEEFPSNGNRADTSGIEPIEKKRSGLYYDPVEDDPRYAEVFKTIDDEVKKVLADYPQRGGRGSVTIYWETKKSLLKQKYGIDWRSPGELNPQVIFD
ncbi:MAG: BPTI/Kunitz-type proteinase inhibitor domain-containing protein [Geobacteraceae bacterium]|nr:BPTI/Kunitz-type proteinase inhibitor domain-containing protein [Geobacteraceae bacterium]